jgi:U4/U6 small nuclear ribonucleoprotein PRP4
MSGLAWHPRATIGQDAAALNFASGGADHKVKLWSLSSERPLATLSGHTARVCRVAFHPTSSYLASAAFDGTWRLWDVVSQKELMVQEGHSKEVYAVEFQDDGALAVSGFVVIGCNELIADALQWIRRDRKSLGSSHRQNSNGS